MLMSIEGAKRFTRGALLFSILPVGGLAFYAPLSVCEIAAEWAESRHPAQVSFDEVAALPLPFQRALLAELPDADRVRLWTDHLNAFLEDQSRLSPAQLRTRAMIPDQLTKAQRDLLLEMRADLSTLTSSAVPTGQQFLAYARYQARAHRIFENRADFDRITSRIGADLSVAERDALIADLQSEVMHRGEAQLRELSWRVASTFTRAESCNCNGLFSCGDPNQTLCLQTSPPCEEAPCSGTIGGGICRDGTCQNIQ